MTGQPRPKPTRTRGRLPTVAQLGGRCQVCDNDQPGTVERMHLLRGVWKEDVPELIMLGCGGYGCQIHELHTRGSSETRRAAAIQIRAVMTDTQRRAIVERRGLAYLEDAYPSFGVRAAGE